MLLDVEIPTSTPSIPPTDSIRQVTEEIIRQATTDPETFWQGVMNSALHFGLKVIVALLIYVIGAWVIRRIKKLLYRVFDRRHTERTLATFISSLVSITLTVMLVLATIGTLGVDTTSFAALLTAGGMAIGMALSGTVQNFAGGIMLLIFRPFKAGDFIKASGESGTVMEVTIVSTKILTTDNRVIILPNGALFSGNIENVSAQPLRRVEWIVSVEYGSDAQKCMDTLQAIMRSHKLHLSIFVLDLSRTKITKNRQVSFLSQHLLELRCHLNSTTDHNNVNIIRRTFEEQITYIPPYDITLQMQRVGYIRNHVEYIFIKYFCQFGVG